MTASPAATRIAQLLGYPTETPPATPAPVFLLGAGFSRAISPAMPLLPELSQMTWNEYRYRDQIAPDIALLLQRDIEEALSLLLLSKPWVRESEQLRHRALYLELAQVVAEVINRQETQTIAHFAGDAPEWLYTLIAYWHRNLCPVITLNYDTLIERVAREFHPDQRQDYAPCAPWRLYPSFLTNSATRSGANFNSYPIPTFRLLKLHGSTNWFYSGRESSRGENIYYTCPSGPVSFWRRGGRVEDDADRACVGDKYPFIVPPIYDKTPLMTHETVQSIWGEAGRALAAAREIYIIGYSLPKSDRALHYFLNSTVNPEATVYIVSRRTDSLERYQAALPVQHRAQRVIQPFQGDDSVRNLVASLAAQQPAPPPGAPGPAVPSPLSEHVGHVQM